MNTNLKVKKRFYPIFTKEIWKRLKKGKTKYQLQGDDTKEGTDIAFEVAPNFIVGDIIKYLVEYQNTKNPRCLFDVAGFAFILWLKNHK